MDKGQALYSFWSSLGIPAYEESTVPDRKDISYPYVSFQKLSGSLEDTLYPTASIYSRQSSWTEADSILAQLEAKFINGGNLIKLDNGYLYIAKGSPFATGMKDDSDDIVKRYVINLAVEFLTAV